MHTALRNHTQQLIITEDLLSLSLMANYYIYNVDKYSIHNIGVEGHYLVHVI
jgi:hypothetical protein